MTSTEDIRRRYRRYSASGRKQRSWRADNPGNIAIRGELVQAVFALAGERLCRANAVLDLGCGTGWWLDHLAAAPHLTAALHGVELLPERARVAAARAPTATVVTGDACELPYPDASFDVVTLFTVLSSLETGEDTARALVEARRVLAGDGVLLIWEPRIATPFNRATRLIDLPALRRALPGMTIEQCTTTLLPPLARHLGSATERLYPQLVRLAPLRTHRLMCAQPR